MFTHSLISTLLTQSSLFALSLGIITCTSLVTLAHPEYSQANYQIAQSLASTSVLVDGVYLYGSSNQPEQIGQEYLVFNVVGGRVVGAFYMPQSEFNCFSGTVEGHKMNLSVIDPYDHTVHPYAIALETVSSVASNGQTYQTLGLQGYKQISTVSSNDQRMLGVCQKNSLGQ